jgi:hypothetical protein
MPSLFIRSQLIHITENCYRAMYRVGNITHRFSAASDESGLAIVSSINVVSRNPGTTISRNARTSCRPWMISSQLKPSTKTECCPGKAV